MSLPVARSGTQVVLESTARALADHLDINKGPAAVVCRIQLQLRSDDFRRDARGVRNGREGRGNLRNVVPAWNVNTSVPSSPATRITRSCTRAAVARLEVDVRLRASIAPVLGVADVLSNSVRLSMAVTTAELSTAWLLPSKVRGRVSSIEVLLNEGFHPGRDASQGRRGRGGTETDPVDRAGTGLRGCALELSQIVNRCDHIIDVDLRLSRRKSTLAYPRRRVE